MTTKVENSYFEQKGVSSKNSKQDGYTHAVHFNRIVIRILGVWPTDEIKWFATVRLIFILFIMLSFATISQSIKMTKHLKDLNIVTEIFVNCNVPTTIAAVKLFNIWYHRSVLKDLLLEIIHDWESPHTEEELAIMWTVAKLSRLFCVANFMINKAVLGTQFWMCFVSPLFKVLKLDSNDTVEWPLYMMGSFPYDVQKPLYYEFSMTGQTLSNILASSSFESTDAFFVILTIHLIGQLSILKMNISKLPKKLENDDDKRQFYNRFAIFHTRHNQLWRFSIALEDSFNGMFLTQMIPCIFVICTQGYQVIMVNLSNYILELFSGHVMVQAETNPIAGSDDVSIMELMFMIYFLVLFLSIIFVYCFIAEVLRQKSAEISNAVYDCDWTVLPPHEAKILIFIILRAQHPFELTAGKFAAFSLQLYCSILKTSAGYLSMLLAVKDRLTE